MWFVSMGRTERLQTGETMTTTHTIDLYVNTTRKGGKKRHDLVRFEVRPATLASMEDRALGVAFIAELVPVDCVNADMSSRDRAYAMSRAAEYLRRLGYRSGAFEIACSSRGQSHGCRMMKWGAANRQRACAALFAPVVEAIASKPLDVQGIADVLGCDDAAARHAAAVVAENFPARWFGGVLTATPQN
jgi:hypothetical protein